MRTLVVAELVTLDGVMEAPGGEPTHPHSGWATPFMDADAVTYKLTEAMEAESLLLGRITYEGFASAWPVRSGPFADKVNSMPKHVASTTLTDVGWNAQLLRGDVADAVRALKAGDGGPLLVAGSATLVHTLLHHGLVDELRLMVFPVSIGHGLQRDSPDERQQLSFRLTHHTTFTTGVMVVHCVAA